MSSIGNTIWRCVHAWVLTTDIVQLHTIYEQLHFSVHIINRMSVLHVYSMDMMCDPSSFIRTASTH